MTSIYTEPVLPTAITTPRLTTVPAGLTEYINCIPTDIYNIGALSKTQNGNYVDVFSAFKNTSTPSTALTDIVGSTQTGPTDLVANQPSPVLIYPYETLNEDMSSTATTYSVSAAVDNCLADPKCFAFTISDSVSANLLYNPYQPLYSQFLVCKKYTTRSGGPYVGAVPGVELDAFSFTNTYLKKVTEKVDDFVYASRIVKFDLSAIRQAQVVCKPRSGDQNTPWRVIQPTRPINSCTPVKNTRIYDNVDTCELVVNGDLIESCLKIEDLNNLYASAYINQLSRSRNGGMTFSSQWNNPDNARIMKMCIDKSQTNPYYILLGINSWIYYTVNFSDHPSISGVAAYDITLLKVGGIQYLFWTDGNGYLAWRKTSNLVDTSSNSFGYKRYPTGQTPKKISGFVDSVSGKSYIVLTTYEDDKVLKLEITGSGITGDTIGTGAYPIIDNGNTLTPLVTKYSDLSAHGLSVKGNASVNTLLAVGSNEIYLLLGSTWNEQKNGIILKWNGIKWFEFSTQYDNMSNITIYNCN